jgi:hypothetical protein
MDPDAQAAPDDTATPSRSSAWSRTSPAVPSNSTERVLGSTRSGGPLRCTCGIFASMPAHSPSRSAAQAAARSVSSFSASAQATPSPTIPATFSVPPRRRPSWPPPSRSGAKTASRRATRQPTPLGPPSLWAERESQSTGTSRRSTGILPTAWVASTWIGTPRAFTRRAMSAMGCTTPVSLLAQIRDTSAVSGSRASATSSAERSPSASTSSRVIRQPRDSRSSRGASTEGCSTLELTTWRPRPSAGATAHSVVLFDSVAPAVKITSPGSTPSSDATWSRAPSTSARAALPSACTLEGLP